LGKNHVKYILLPILVFFIIALIPSSTFAATVNSNWATTIPTIDGTASSGEWDDAAANAITAYDGSTPLSVFLYAKNDANNLYLRIQWTDASTNYLDLVGVFFDEGNDGNWSGPGIENGVLVYMNATWYLGFDGYCEIGYLISNDTVSQDGAWAVTHPVTAYIVELSIPLGRADLEDLQSSAGSLIGIAVIIGDSFTQPPGTSKYYQYPNNTKNDQGTASFQLATAPSGSEIGTPFTLIFLISSIAIITILKIAKVSRARAAQIY
jgi:hypothetical protein